MRRPQPAVSRHTNPTPNAAPVEAPQAGSIEAEIADLTATRAGLTEQLPPLERTKQAALLERRNLILGKADERVIAEANRVCREAESEWFAIDDAIKEADRRLADAIERRDAAAMEAERQAVAGRLERNASEVETAAASLAKAIESVSLAYTRLAIGITSQAAGQFDPTLGVASPMQVANVLLYGGLAHALPSLDLQAEMKPWSMYAHTAKVEGAEPVEAASAFAARIRDAAAKVRAHEIDHLLPATEDLQPIPRMNSEEETVYVTAPFFYHRATNDPIIVPVGEFSVPIRVAELAVEAGCASEVEPMGWGRLSGKDYLEGRGPKLVGMRVSPLGYDECHDLGFNLMEWRKAELEARLTGQPSDREAA
ncbi:hypothetical protein [Methylobacterium bullatum]|uniref:Uncharacterized protein n=1 Tax=Methylobacterium bullatum TaxID=570505 RepID=A0A679KGX6_9HYPH|nr:hypothetical protein MBLL_03418 [Methylobacterium bullatum]